MGGAEEERSFDFYAKSLVSSIWSLCFGGEFAKFGDIPLLMAGGKTPLKLHKNESALEAVKMEKSKETIRAEPYTGPPFHCNNIGSGVEKVKVELRSQNS